MEATQYLQAYKKRVDKELEKYFSQKIKQAREIHSLAEEAVQIIKEITMAGGKRIRPAILYYSYLAGGGKDNEEIVKTSMSIELAHIFLLIHDDIIDKDDIRHGVLTAHERYSQKARRILVPERIKNEAAHFGNAMAIVVGDMASAMAYEIIFNSKFAPETVIKALDSLQNIIYKTLPGEMMDIEMELKGKASEEEIIKMHEGKTAHYTFEGPIDLGWVLADKSSNGDLKKLSQYGLLIGKAFQIRDDILGVFGDEKKLGKPVGSDIIEGKQTLLILKAEEKGTASQKKIINKYFGKKELAESELEEIRKVIKETGALEYSLKLSEKMAEEGRAYLNQINFKNKQAQDFFKTLIEYIIRREK